MIEAHKSKKSARNGVADEDTGMPGRSDAGFHRLLAGLAALTCVAFMVSLLTGPAEVGPAELFALLAGRGGTPDNLILVEIRLPRAILGLLVGAALGLSGAALQGYLRNPLAEPGIIGVSAGASFGAVLAIHTGAASAFALALPLAGLAGAGAAVFIVIVLAGAVGGALTVILAGVAVSSVAIAATSLVLNLSQNPFAAVEMVFWLMGSLAERSLVQVWLVGPPLVAGLAVLLFVGRQLDALTLGEDAAANLGVNHRYLRWLIIVGTALSVGAATAVSGIIGFVGLIVPHVLRPFVDHRPGRLLIAAMFGGAILVLLADVTIRKISPGGELRLGVATALIGAPFFVWLVLRLRTKLGP